MNVKRCTSSTFLYNNEVWVFGGYTSQYKRSKKIEKYIENENKWVLIPFKLFKGFENGNIYPSLDPHKIILLGGKLNFGHNKNVWEYDLLRGTVINKRPLFKDGILTKYFPKGKREIIIIGELENDYKKFFNIYKETYNIETFTNVIVSPIKVKNKLIEKLK